MTPQMITVLTRGSAIQIAAAEHAGESSAGQEGHVDSSDFPAGSSHHVCHVLKHFRSVYYARVGAGD